MEEAVEESASVEEGEPRGDVHRIELPMEWKPGHVAAYFVEGDENALIDAGVPGEEAEDVLEEKLAGCDYGTDDIDHLIITHPHTDHIGHAETVIEESDPTVYAPEGTLDYLSVEGVEETTRERAREVGLEGSFLEDAVERWRDAIERNRGCLPPDEIDVFLSGGDRVDVGDRSFEAVHTPGHQKHHLCFETSIEGENVLFSGDALTGKFRSVIYHVGFAEEMYDAVGAYYAAFERLERLSVDRVYPGHGPVFTDYDDAVERSVKSLDRLIDRVEEALNEFDEASALDVALSRADDPATVEHTIFDTVGGLGYLEKQGKVDSYVEGGVRYFEAVDEE